MRLPWPYDQLFALTAFACLQVTGDNRSGYGHCFDLQIWVEELPDEPGKVVIWRDAFGDDERGILDLETDELECRLGSDRTEVFHHASSFAAWFLDYWRARIRDSLMEL
jgi:hypothetical protein